MEALSIYVAVEDDRLENFVKLTATARLQCKFLAGLRNGDILPCVDREVFKSVLRYLDGNEDLDQLLLDEPNTFQTQIAKLWWLAGQLDLPRLQNAVVDFARDLYAHALFNGEDYPIDADAFECLPPNDDGPCLFSGFLVAFHAGLLANTRLSPSEINRTLRQLKPPLAERIRRHAAGRRAGHFGDVILFNLDYFKIGVPHGRPGEPRRRSQRIRYPEILICRTPPEIEKPTFTDVKFMDLPRFAALPPTPDASPTLDGPPSLFSDGTTSTDLAVSPSLTSTYPTFFREDFEGSSFILERDYHTASALAPQFQFHPAHDTSYGNLELCNPDVASIHSSRSPAPSLEIVPASQATATLRAASPVGSTSQPSGGSIPRSPTVSSSCAHNFLLSTPSVNSSKVVADAALKYGPDTTPSGLAPQPERPATARSVLGREGESALRSPHPAATSDEEASETKNLQSYLDGSDSSLQSALPVPIPISAAPAASRVEKLVEIYESRPPLSPPKPPPSTPAFGPPVETCLQLPAMSHFESSIRLVSMPAIERKPRLISIHTSRPTPKPKPPHLCTKSVDRLQTIIPSPRLGLEEKLGAISPHVEESSGTSDSDISTATTALSAAKIAGGMDPLDQITTDATSRNHQHHSAPAQGFSLSDWELAEAEYLSLSAEDQQRMLDNILESTAAKSNVEESGSEEVVFDPVTQPISTEDRQAIISPNTLSSGQNDVLNSSPESQRPATGSIILVAESGSPPSVQWNAVSPGFEQESWVGTLNPESPVAQNIADPMSPSRVGSLQQSPDDGPYSHENGYTAGPSNIPELNAEPSTCPTNQMPVKSCEKILTNSSTFSATETRFSRIERKGMVVEGNLQQPPPPIPSESQRFSLETLNTVSIDESLSSHPESSELVADDASQAIPYIAGHTTAIPPRTVQVTVDFIDQICSLVKQGVNITITDTRLESPSASNTQARPSHTLSSRRVTSTLLISSEEFSTELRSGSISGSLLTPSISTSSAALQDSQSTRQLPPDKEADELMSPTPTAVPEPVPPIVTSALSSDDVEWIHLASSLEDVPEAPMSPTSESVPGSATTNADRATTPTPETSKEAETGVVQDPPRDFVPPSSRPTLWSKSSTPSSKLTSLSHQATLWTANVTQSLRSTPDPHDLVMPPAIPSPILETADAPPSPESADVSCPEAVKITPLSYSQVTQTDIPPQPTQTTWSMLDVGLNRSRPAHSRSTSLKSTTAAPPKHEKRTRPRANTTPFSQNAQLDLQLAPQVIHQPATKQIAKMTHTSSRPTLPRSATIASISNASSRGHKRTTSQSTTITSKGDITTARRRETTSRLTTSLSLQDVRLRHISSRQEFYPEIPPPPPAKEYPMPVSLQAARSTSASSRPSASSTLRLGSHDNKSAHSLQSYGKSSHSSTSRGIRSAHSSSRDVRLIPSSAQDGRSLRSSSRDLRLTTSSSSQARTSHTPYSRAPDPPQTQVLLAPRSNSTLASKESKRKRVATSPPMEPVSQPTDPMRLMEDTLETYISGAPSELDPIENWLAEQGSTYLEHHGAESPPQDLSRSSSTLGMTYDRIRESVPGAPQHFTPDPHRTFSTMSEVACADTTPSLSRRGSIKQRFKNFCKGKSRRNQEQWMSVPNAGTMGESWGPGPFPSSHRHSTAYMNWLFWMRFMNARPMEYLTALNQQHNGLIGNQAQAHRRLSAPVQAATTRSRM